jgi:hypothetical protein
MGIRMTQFDTELEEKARQNAQNMLRTAIAPPGPAPGTQPTPDKEKKSSPVTINIAGANEPTWLEQQIGGAKALGQNLGLAAQMPAAALNWANQNLIPPMTGGYKFGREFNVGGVPGGTPGTVYDKMVENLYPWVKPKEFFTPAAFGLVPVPGRKTTPPVIPPPGELAAGHVPGQTLSRAQEIIDMAKNARGGYEAAPSNVGWFQVEGGPRQTITDEYWQTPIPGRGSFNVIPGSAAGPAWAPPVTVRMYGKDYTLPASTVAELGRTFQREAPKTPEWTIPPEYESKMAELTKIIQAPVGAYTTGQRHAAAAAFGDLNKQVSEMNKYQADMWRTQMGYPLEERKTAATEMGALAQARNAEAQLMLAGPHADYFKKLAGEGQLVPPGYAIFSPESRKAIFENPQKSEAFAPLARDAVLASMEETPTGKIVNPFAFMGYMNLMGKTVAKERGQEWKDITVKEMNREMVAPYIHRIIQTNPKTSKLKSDSKEYQQLYNDTLRELYK